MPKLSIIVPVYNVESYLPQCIDSILVQTFTDWELLLVDDGSPDRSGEICDEYAVADSRIRVFHKENGGVSSARNVGLDNAKGKWVTFIDSDDYILPSFFEGLFKPINEGEVLDFIQGGCSNVKNEEIVSINQSYKPFVGDNPGFLFRMFRGLTFSKLFSLENVNRGADGLPLRFDKQMKIAEDMAFTLDYLLTVKRYAFVEEKGYCYRADNMESATKKMNADYKSRLCEFKHLYKSVFAYVGYHRLEVCEYSKRKSNLGKILFNTVLELYHMKMRKSERMMHLKMDFTEEQIELLKFAKFTKAKAILAYILSQNCYELFDICAYCALKLY